MGLGAGILLLAVGAIFTFAVDWHIKDVDLDVVGVIMMVAGVIGLVAYLSILRRRPPPPLPPRAPAAEEEERRRGSGY
ncbi:DUF6458 family protein [Streptomyces polyrhachis]|uniref:DUF6458 family protein n=1 Tax=Streptomyces polyrhachis TaxID=1282885 RepID=A0ABW2GBB3_9ACTN